MSNTKAVKVFVAHLAKAARSRGDANFASDELERFARDMQLGIPDFKDFLEVRGDCGGGGGGAACGGRGGEGGSGCLSNESHRTTPSSPRFRPPRPPCLSQKLNMHGYLLATNKTVGGRKVWRLTGSVM
jgi:hypothetical protein